MNEQRSTRPAPLQQYVLDGKNHGFRTVATTARPTADEPQPRSVAAAGAGVGITDSEKRVAQPTAARGAVLPSH